MTPLRRTLLALFVWAYAVVSGSLITYAMAAMMAAWMVAAVFIG